jgi:co-chaperonin GroES (HSP10)
LIQVKGDVVLVKIIPEENVTESGLIVAKLKEDPPYIGQVIAIGEGVRDYRSYVDISNPEDPTNVEVKHEIILVPIMGVSVGDKVIFPRWAGLKVDIEDDGDYLFIREDHMLAVIED